MGFCFFKGEKIGEKNSLKAILFLALVTFNYPVLSADGDSV